MRTIHRSCHRCPFPNPPPPPRSGDSRDPPRAQAKFPHPKGRREGVWGEGGLLLWLLAVRIHPWAHGNISAST